MFGRFSDRPLVLPEDVRPFDDRFEVVGVFNPGVTEFDGEILLLLRVAVRPKQDDHFLRVPMFQKGKIEILQLDKSQLDCSDERVAVEKGKRFLTSMSYFQIATSKDGIHFKIEEGRTILPRDELEEYGIEDPRIVRVNGKYYILYSAISECGICVKSLVTEDFIHYKELGAILHPDNKDAVLFPEQIGGKYYMLHRPSTSEFGNPEIWLAESEDLIHWGKHRRVAGIRAGMWDGLRVGSSGVPIRTERGWLVVYHGADVLNGYSLGALLLDAEEPWKVLGRSEEPFMRPELECERKGFFNNVVFACGGIVRADKLIIYYGAADKYVCGGEIKIQSVMEYLQ